MCTEKLLVIAGLGKANVSCKLKSFLIQQILCIYEYCASIET